MQKRTFCQRIIALITFFAFMVSDCLLPIPGGLAQIIPAAEIPAAISHFEIPADLGQVSESVYAPGSNGVILHIQTAHRHFEAQENIQKILRYLSDHYGTNQLFLEGAWSELHPDLLSIFPDHPEVNRRLIQELMKRGSLTGPEAFLVDQASAKGWGIEDAAAYRKNFEDFKAVMENQKPLSAFLQFIFMSLERLSASVLGKDLRGFLEEEKSFHDQQTSERWFSVLKENAQKYLRLDLTDFRAQADWPLLVRYYRLQEISSKIDRQEAEKEKKAFLEALQRESVDSDLIASVREVLNGKREITGQDGLLAGSDLQNRLGYSNVRILFERLFGALSEKFSFEAYPELRLEIQQLVFLSELSGPGLYEETDRLASKIKDHLAPSQNEKKILRLLADEARLEKLFRLELTRNEYEQSFEEDRIPVTPEAWSLGIKTLFQETGQKNFVEFKDNLEEITKLSNRALSFYRHALEREKHFLQNTEARLQAINQTKAILVTGGFHSEGIKQEAARLGKTYIQITPQITRFDKNEKENYLRAMLGTEAIQTSHLEAVLTLQLLENGVDPALLGFGPSPQAVAGEILKLAALETAGRAELRRELAASLLQSFAGRSELRAEGQTDAERVSAAAQEFFRLAVQSDFEMEIPDPSPVRGGKVILLSRQEAHVSENEVRGLVIRSGATGVGVNFMDVLASRDGNFRGARLLVSADNSFIEELSALIRQQAVEVVSDVRSELHSVPVELNTAPSRDEESPARLATGEQAGLPAVRRAGGRSELREKDAQESVPVENLKRFAKSLQVLSLPQHAGILTQIQGVLKPLAEGPDRKTYLHLSKFSRYLFHSKLTIVLNGLKALGSNVTEQGNNFELRQLYDLFQTAGLLSADGWMTGVAKPAPVAAARIAAAQRIGRFSTPAVRSELHSAPWLNTLMPQPKEGMRAELRQPVTLLSAITANIRKAAVNIGYDPELLERYLTFSPENLTEVTIPYLDEKGEPQTTKGFRAKHTDVLGPGGGGIRFSRKVDMDKDEGLALGMTIKLTNAWIPFSGGKGGVVIDPLPPFLQKQFLKDPSKLSPEDIALIKKQARVMRGYMRQMNSAFGPDTDRGAPDMGTSGLEMAWGVDEFLRMQFEAGEIRDPEIIKVFEDPSFQPKIKAADVTETPYLKAALERFNKEDGGTLNSWELSVLTGKPVGLGGSLGREDATGRGGFYVTEEYFRLRGESLKGKKVILQGFGNVARHYAKFLAEAGAVIVGIQGLTVSNEPASIHNEKGIDVNALAKYLDEAKGRDLKTFTEDHPAQAHLISTETFWSMEADILSPAAVDLAITPEVAKLIRAKTIIELANTPVAGTEAEEILLQKGIDVVPDVIANAGGVIVSYWEWIQNRLNKTYPENLVVQLMRHQILQSFRNAHRLAQTRKIDLRMAANIVSLIAYADALTAQEPEWAAKFNAERSPYARDPELQFWYPRTNHQLNQRQTDAERLDLIGKAEAARQQEIGEMAGEIQDRLEAKRGNAVLLGGTDGNGKELLAVQLQAALSARGIKSEILRYDHSSPEEIKQLLSGGTLRLKGRDVHLGDDEVLIVEGDYALDAEVVNLFDPQHVYPVYVTHYPYIWLASTQEGQTVTAPDSYDLRTMFKISETHSSLENTIEAMGEERSKQMERILPRSSIPGIPVRMFNAYIPYSLPIYRATLYHRLTAVRQRMEEDTFVRRRIDRLISILEKVDPWNERLLPPQSSMGIFLRQFGHQMADYEEAAAARPPMDVFIRKNAISLVREAGLLPQAALERIEDLPIRYEFVEGTPYLADAQPDPTLEGGWLIKINKFLALDPKTTGPYSDEAARNAVIAKLSHLLARQFSLILFHEYSRIKKSAKTPVAMWAASFMALIYGLVIRLRVSEASEQRQRLRRFQRYVDSLRARSSHQRQKSFKAMTEPFQKFEGDYAEFVISLVDGPKGTLIDSAGALNMSRIGELAAKFFAEHLNYYIPNLAERWGIKLAALVSVQNTLTLPNLAAQAEEYRQFESFLSEPAWDAIYEHHHWRHQRMEMKFRVLDPVKGNGLRETLPKWLERVAFSNYLKFELFVRNFSGIQETLISHNKDFLARDQLPADIRVRLKGKVFHAGGTGQTLFEVYDKADPEAVLAEGFIRATEAEAGRTARSELRLSETDTDVMLAGAVIVIAGIMAVGFVLKHYFFSYREERKAIRQNLEAGNTRRVDLVDIARTPVEVLRQVRDILSRGGQFEVTEFKLKDDGFARSYVVSEVRELGGNQAGGRSELRSAESGPLTPKTAISHQALAQRIVQFVQAEKLTVRFFPNAPQNFYLARENADMDMDTAYRLLHSVNADGSHILFLGGLIANQEIHKFQVAPFSGNTSLIEVLKNTLGVTTGQRSELRVQQSARSELRAGQQDSEKQSGWGKDLSDWAETKVTYFANLIREHVIAVHIFMAFHAAMMFPSYIQKFVDQVLEHFGFISSSDFHLMPENLFIEFPLGVAIAYVIGHTEIWWHERAHYWEAVRKLVLNENLLSEAQVLERNGSLRQLKLEMKGILPEKLGGFSPSRKEKLRESKELLGLKLWSQWMVKRAAVEIKMFALAPLGLFPGIKRIGLSYQADATFNLSVSAEGPKKSGQMAIGAGIAAVLLIPAAFIFSSAALGILGILSLGVATVAFLDRMFADPGSLAKLRERERQEEEAKKKVESSAGTGQQKWIDMMPDVKNRMKTTRIQTAALPDGTVIGAPFGYRNSGMGGKHTEKQFPKSNISLQEAMFIPLSAKNYEEAQAMTIALQTKLQEVIEGSDGATVYGIGMEGGLAPYVEPQEKGEVPELRLWRMMREAIIKAGYRPGIDVALAIDAAASELQEAYQHHFEQPDARGQYLFWRDGQRTVMSRDDLLALYLRAIDEDIPIISIEDGFAEDDWEGFQMLMEKLGDKAFIVADDLATTNDRIVEETANKKAANALLVKPNQIGTLTETTSAMLVALGKGMELIPSHRSTKPNDTMEAHMALASMGMGLKSGGGANTERLVIYKAVMDAMLAAAQAEGASQEIDPEQAVAVISSIIASSDFTNAGTPTVMLTVNGRIPGRPEKITTTGAAPRGTSAGSREAIDLVDELVERGPLTEKYPEFFDYVEEGQMYRFKKKISRDAVEAKNDPDLLSRWEQAQAYSRKGVATAVETARQVIAGHFAGRSASELGDMLTIDREILQLELQTARSRGKEVTDPVRLMQRKWNLGMNGTLAASLALARFVAAAQGKELWQLWRDQMTGAMAQVIAEYKTNNPEWDFIQGDSGDWHSIQSQNSWDDLVAGLRKVESIEAAKGEARTPLYQIIRKYLPVYEQASAQEETSKVVALEEAERQAGIPQGSLTQSYPSSDYEAHVEMKPSASRTLGRVTLFKKADPYQRTTFLIKRPNPVNASVQGLNEGALAQVGSELGLGPRILHSSQEVIIEEELKGVPLSQRGINMSRREAALFGHAMAEALNTMIQKNEALYQANVPQTHIFIEGSVEEGLKIRFVDWSNSVWLPAADRDEVLRTTTEQLAYVLRTFVDGPTRGLLAWRSFENHLKNLSIETESSLYLDILERVRTSLAGESNPDEQAREGWKTFFAKADRQPDLATASLRVTVGSWADAIAGSSTVKSQVQIQNEGRQSLELMIMHDASVDREIAQAVARDLYERGILGSNIYLSVDKILGALQQFFSERSISESVSHDISSKLKARLEAAQQKGTLTAEIIQKDLADLLKLASVRNHLLLSQTFVTTLQSLQSRQVFLKVKPLTKMKHHVKAVVLDVGFEEGGKPIHRYLIKEPRGSDEQVRSLRASQLHLGPHVILTRSAEVNRQGETAELVRRAAIVEDFLPADRNIQAVSDAEIQAVAADAVKRKNLAVNLAAKIYRMFDPDRRNKTVIHSFEDLPESIYILQRAEGLNVLFLDWAKGPAAKTPLAELLRPLQEAFGRFGDAFWSDFKAELLRVAGTNGRKLTFDFQKAFQQLDSAPPPSAPSGFTGPARSELRAVPDELRITSSRDEGSPASPAGGRSELRSFNEIENELNLPAGTLADRYSEAEYSVRFDHEKRPVRSARILGTLTFISKTDSANKFSYLIKKTEFGEIRLAKEAAALQLGPQLLFASDELIIEEFLPSVKELSSRGLLISPEESTGFARAMAESFHAMVQSGTVLYSNTSPQTRVFVLGTVTGGIQVRFADWSKSVWLSESKDAEEAKIQTLMQFAYLMKTFLGKPKRNILAWHAFEQSLYHKNGPEYLDWIQEVRRRYTQEIGDAKERASWMEFFNQADKVQTIVRLVSDTVVSLLEPIRGTTQLSLQSQGERSIRLIIENQSTIQDDVAAAIAKDLFERGFLKKHLSLTPKKIQTTLAEFLSSNQVGEEKQKRTLELAQKRFGQKETIRLQEIQDILGSVFHLAQVQHAGFLIRDYVDYLLAAEGRRITIRTSTLPGMRNRETGEILDVFFEEDAAHPIKQYVIKEAHTGYEPSRSQQASDLNLGPHVIYTQESKRGYLRETVIVEDYLPRERNIKNIDPEKFKRDPGAVEILANNVAVQFYRMIDPVRGHETVLHRFDNATEHLYVLGKEDGYHFLMIDWAFSSSLADWRFQLDGENDTDGSLGHLKVLLGILLSNFEKFGPEFSVQFESRLLDLAERNNGFFAPKIHRAFELLKSEKENLKEAEAKPQQRKKTRFPSPPPYGRKYRRSELRQGQNGHSFAQASLNEISVASREQIIGWLRGLTGSEAQRHLAEVQSVGHGRRNPVTSARRYLLREKGNARSELRNEERLISTLTNLFAAGVSETERRMTLDYERVSDLEGVFRFTVFLNGILPVPLKGFARVEAGMVKLLSLRLGTVGIDNSQTGTVAEDFSRAQNYLGIRTTVQTSTEVSSKTATAVILGPSAAFDYALLVAAPAVFGNGLTAVIVENEKEAKVIADLNRDLSAQNRPQIVAIPANDIADARRILLEAARRRNLDVNKLQGTVVLGAEDSSLMAQALREQFPDILNITSGIAKNFLAIAGQISEFIQSLVTQYEGQLRSARSA